MKKLNRSEEEKIISLYKQELNITKVCKITNHSDITIRKILRKHNILIIKNPNQVNLDIIKSIELYNSGKTLKDISIIYNCSSTLISKILKNKINKRIKLKYIETNSKLCKKCKKIKTIDNFHRDKTHIDGFRSHCKSCVKEYTNINRKIISKQETEKIKLDSNFKIIKLLRNRIKQSIKRNSKSLHTKELIGCTINTLKEHLQQTTIQNGHKDFNINNYSGKEYHIDHIIPCSVFNLSCSYHQKLCFHYNNLQILDAKTNMIKGDKLD